MQILPVVQAILAPREFGEIRSAVSGVARSLSADQLLELADDLHQQIRERREQTYLAARAMSRQAHAS